MLRPLRALNVISKTLYRLFHMNLFIDGRGSHAQATRERRRDSKVREENGREVLLFPSRPLTATPLARAFSR